MDPTKLTGIAIVFALVLVGGAFVLTRGSGNEEIVPGSNVSVVDGKQIIQITAKGGYTPGRSVAKAGIPTILRIDTKATFDCSSAVRIPSMDINRNLPPSGTTDIDLGTPVAGVFQGSCGMGMYPFEIDFES